VASLVQFHTFLMNYIIAYCALIILFIIIPFYLSQPKIKEQFR
jgi:hypothetical protein